MGTGSLRNAPCPCGSGKKFKRCHGDIAELPTAGNVIVPTDTAAVVLDSERRHLLAISDRLVINQVSRDAKLCEESFDRFFGDEFQRFSQVSAHVAALVLAGITSAPEGDSGELRRTAALRLQTTASLLVGAVDLLRRGHRLAPCILARSATESICTVIAIAADPDKWRQFKDGTLKFSKTPTWAKTVLPTIAQQYGLLSTEFAHSSRFYDDVNTPQIVESADDSSITTVYLILLSTLVMAWMAAELVFFDIVPEPRFWKTVPGGVVFQMNDETRRWYNELFGLDGDDERS